MQEILNSDGVRVTALMLRQAYTAAWNDGLEQAPCDAEDLGDRLFELSFVCPHGSDWDNLALFQQFGSHLDYLIGLEHGIEDRFHHYLIGYRSTDHEGTRVIHGLALIKPSLEATWIAATKHIWIVNHGLRVGRHSPQADRFLVWKQLAYGILLSEWLGRSPHRLFTMYGPRVTGSPVQLKQNSNVLAELRYPAARAA